MGCELEEDSVYERIDTTSLNLEQKVKHLDWKASRSLCELQCHQAQLRQLTRA